MVQVGFCLEKRCITDKDNPDKNAEGRGVPKKKLNIFLMSGCI
jgi:hypothetical protein